MSIAPEGSPFQPGVEVAIVAPRGGGNVSFKTAKVGKVFKNGNFKLEGGDQQYRIVRSFGKWTAEATGNDRYNRTAIELITDELRAAAAATTRQNKFANLAEQLSRARNTKVTDAQVATLEALVSEIVGPAK